MDEENVLSRFVASQLRNTEVLSDIAEQLRREIDLDSCRVDQRAEDILIQTRTYEDVLSLSVGFNLIHLSDPGLHTVNFTLTVIREDKINHFDIRYFAVSDEFHLLIEEDDYEGETIPFEQSDIDYIVNDFGFPIGAIEKLEHRGHALELVKKAARHFSMLRVRLEGSGSVKEYSI